MDLDSATNQRFTVDTLFHLIITRVVPVTIRRAYSQPYYQRSASIIALRAPARRNERLNAPSSNHRNDITPSGK